MMLRIKNVLGGFIRKRDMGTALAIHDEQDVSITLRIANNRFGIDRYEMALGTGVSSGKRGKGIVLNCFGFYGDTQLISENKKRWFVGQAQNILRKLGILHHRRFVLSVVGEKLARRSNYAQRNLMARASWLIARAIEPKAELTLVG